MAKRKNGEGTWGKKTIKGVEYQYYRNTNGKYFYGKTQKEIKQKIKDFELKEQETDINAAITFYDFVMSYLNTKKLNIAQTTYDSYEDVINSLLKKSTVGNLDISSVNEDNLRIFVEGLSQKYSKAYIEKFFHIAKPALAYAVDHKYISKNPFDHVKVPSEKHVAVKKKDIPFIIQEDLDKLYEESKRKNENGYSWGISGTSIYGINAQAIVLIGHTGLRISELKGLRWRDIDLDKKAITVSNAMTRARNRDNSGKKYTTIDKEPKSKASIRTIPLSDIALEMISYFGNLRPNHKPDDYVVLNKNGNSPIPRNIQRTLDSMLVRSGCSIEHCGLHGLRHGFGAILLSNGVDIKIVSKLLGHEKISTTYDIYIDFTKEQVENAVISVLNKKD